MSHSDCCFIKHHTMIQSISSEFNPNDENIIKRKRSENDNHDPTLEVVAQLKKSKKHNEEEDCIMNENYCTSDLWQTSELFFQEQLMKHVGPHYSYCKGNDDDIQCKCSQEELEKQVDISLRVPENDKIEWKHVYGYTVPKRAQMDNLFLAKKYKHWRDKVIIFDEQPHFYYLKGKKVGISGTGFIKYFYPNFDSTAAIDSMINRKDFPIADRYKEYRKLKIWKWQSESENLPNQLTGDESGNIPLKEIEKGTGIQLRTWTHGMIRTQDRELCHELIEKQWEENRINASEKGTYNHLCCELYMNAIYDDDRVLRNKSKEFEYAKLFLQDFEKLGWIPLRAELSVWDEEYDLAGQVDALFQRAVDRDRPATPEYPKEIIVVDWKNCRQILFEAFKNQKMFPPLEDLDDCTGVHYRLQVGGIYKNLIEKFYPYKVVKSYIVAFNANYDTYQMYEVPDMDAHFAKMLQHRKKQLLGEIPIPAPH